MDREKKPERRLSTPCIDHGLNTDKGWVYIKRRREVKARVEYAKRLQVPLKALHLMTVYHFCENPRCINTDHMYLGSPLIRPTPDGFFKDYRDRDAVDEGIVELHKLGATKEDIMKMMLVQSNQVARALAKWRKRERDKLNRPDGE